MFKISRVRFPDWANLKNKIKYKIKTTILFCILCLNLIPAKIEIWNSARLPNWTVQVSHVRWPQLAKLVRPTDVYGQTIIYPNLNHTVSVRLGLRLVFGQWNSTGWDYWESLWDAFTLATFCGKNVCNFLLTLATFGSATQLPKEAKASAVQLSLPVLQMFLPKISPVLTLLYRWKRFEHNQLH